MAKDRNEIQIGRNVYVRDTSDMKPEGLDVDNRGRSVHIVRMMDEDGQEIANARIFGTQDECDKMAEAWKTRLLRANPLKFITSSISDIQYDRVIRDNTTGRDKRIKEYRAQIAELSGAKPVISHEEVERIKSDNQRIADRYAEDTKNGRMRADLENGPSGDDVPETDNGVEGVDYDIVNPAPELVNLLKGDPWRETDISTN